MIIFDKFCSMAGLKKKTVVLLLTITLGSSLLLLISARIDSGAIDPRNSNNDPYHTQVGTLPDSLFTVDSNLSLSQTSGYDSYNDNLFFRAMLAVLFVVALAVAAVYVSKKLLPKITNLPGKEIRIIETIHLGPRRSVHLLEIGNRRLLIGSTNENINKLLDLTGISENLSEQEITY